METLRALKILDSGPEERFDRLTRLAKRMFGVSISLVSLVDSDRQWFKSSQGLDATETPRDISFCRHAILGDTVFAVPDTLKDDRFHDNPLVTDAPNIRFYAGCRLTIAYGSKLGTLCIIDHKPRFFPMKMRYFYVI
jgi:GAF domain-containing protein